MERRSPSDDEVVEHLDVDEAERALQVLGKHLIGVARLGNTRADGCGRYVPLIVLCPILREVCQGKGIRRETAHNDNVERGPGESGGVGRMVVGARRPAPTKAVGVGRPGQRLVSQLSSEGSSFQGPALFEPAGAQSCIAAVFIRIVISA